MPILERGSRQAQLSAALEVFQACTNTNDTAVEACRLETCIPSSEERTRQRLRADAPVDSVQEQEHVPQAPPLHRLLESGARHTSGSALRHVGALKVAYV